MVLLIMHVIIPLKKAQKSLLFVIKRQIKAHLEKNICSTRGWLYFPELSC